MPLAAPPAPRPFILRCTAPGEGPGPVRLEAGSMLEAAMDYAEHWPGCGLAGVEVTDPATGARGCFTIEVG